MPEFELTTTQKQVKEFAHQFAKHVVRPVSLQADRDHTLPLSLLQQLGDLQRLMQGNSAGPEYDVSETVERRGPSQRNRTRLIGAEEMAWGDGSVPISIPGPGLGAPPVLLTGTPEQRRRFMAVFDQPGLHWGAYGLTEPGAGSDVSAIRTTCRKDGDDWVLDGRKCFITNGARADWVVIFATVDPTLGRAGQRAFVVEKGTLGFSVGKIEDKMGLRASETAELVLDGCRVPGDNLLGGEEFYAGKEGFMTAMKTFDSSRPMVGALAVGIARASLEAATEFVRSDGALWRHTPRYTQLATLLAEDARLVDAARLMCWRAAWMADEGVPNAKEASMAKAYAARAAMKVCSDALQILGAHGIEASHFVEKWYRDIKVFDIFEGTAQIQRVVIARRILRDSPAF